MPPAPLLSRSSGYFDASGQNGFVRYVEMAIWERLYPLRNRQILAIPMNSKMTIHRSYADSKADNPVSCESSILECALKPSTELYSLAPDNSKRINLVGIDVPASLLLAALIEEGVIIPRQLITTSELAALIRMKSQTIAKWRSAGITDPPPVIHLGRQVRYDVEEVMAWIYRNRL